MQRILTFISIFTITLSISAQVSIKKKAKLMERTESSEYKAMINASDEAMVFPESIIETAEAEDSIRTYSWLERQLIHADPDCISDEQVDEVPDSIYIMRLTALPTVIDMPYNEPIKKCLELYVHRRRAMVERMVGVGYNHYFPIFEEALQRHGMPSELKFLACIESALKQNAFSRAKAAGLWQFMPATGMLQGLEVNSIIDERYDLYKSTDAACKYLKQLYSIYNDWSLAIAAYNCGPGNINKAIARSGGRRSFWEIYSFLPSETRTYVPLFVAATYIMTYHCEHNLCATIGDLPPQCDTIMIHNMVHFEQIANVLDIPLEVIESLNPQYIADIVPGTIEKPKSIMLPQEKSVEFIELQDSILAFKADSLLPHNGEIQDVWIKGRRNSFVQSGGNSLSTGKGRKGTKPAATTGGKDIHIVQKGQTLSYIARRYGTTVSNIKALNGLKKDAIAVGQRLRVR